MLALIVEIAADATAFDGATVRVRRGGDLGTVAATHPEMMLLDVAQYGEGAGPCLEAIEQGEAVEWNAGDERWRAFQEAAAGLGITTSLYGRRQHRLTPEALELATQCALQLAIALQMLHTTRSLAQVARRASDAIGSQAVIEQAKGVLAAQHGVPARPQIS